MQIIEQIRKEIEAKGISVLKLSKETGISAYKIYKWLDGKGNPKHEDSQLLDKWLNGCIDKVPNGLAVEQDNHANGNSIVLSKDETIAVLKDQIEMMKRNQGFNSNDLIAMMKDLKETVNLSMAVSMTILDCLREHRSAMEKGIDKDKILAEERRFLSVNLAEILKKDKLIG